MDESTNQLRQQLLDAAKPHVPFDGWTQATLDAAIEDTGLTPAMAKAAYPRGAVDLALAFHAEGDAAMVSHMASEDLEQMRYRDRVAAAVRFRLEAVEDKELVRRGVTLFALPHHAFDGAQAIWGTVDKIWTALGDTSEDINWYTKRATLSGVYSSTVLYWLGDDSPDNENTWAFLDRRIDDVMRIEKVKSKVRDNKTLSSLMSGPMSVLSKIRKPGTTADLPGRWTR